MYNIILSKYVVDMITIPRNSAAVPLSGLELDTKSCDRETTEVFPAATYFFRL